MQLDLLLRIALRSEASCAALHAIPAFARYAEQNRARIMQRFTKFSLVNGCAIYKSFGKLHYSNDQQCLPAMETRVMEDRAGDKFWYCNGELHRTDLDAHGRRLPTKVYANGDQMWHWRGKLHRTDRDEHGRVLPAKVLANGDMEWWQNGVLHRTCCDDHGRTLPAKSYGDGDMEWWQNGELHRTDLDVHGHVLPTKVYANGDKVWHWHGKRHRTCRKNYRVLPAIVRTDGYKAWYYNGELHRIDCDAQSNLLPAIINSIASEYWISGVKIE